MLPDQFWLTIPVADIGTTKTFTEVLGKSILSMNRNLLKHNCSLRLPNQSLRTLKKPSVLSVSNKVNMIVYLHI